MRRALILLALIAAQPAVSSAMAQTLIVSPVTDAVAVTLYRDPDRSEGAMDANWPGGYALVTETRRVSLPAGPYVLRFEGVAEGMLPESAIVTGLPQQVGEKNRDARLLSPAALVDAYLKRRVTLQRTSRATGKTVTQEAVIQSGPAGGIVLTTAEGVEALGCSGLPEAIRYPGVPEDLSAKPTLSVTGESAAPAEVTLQLSYLSQGFDWSTSYVAELAPDGESMSLFGWLTVANGGSQGFADAHMQAVAGRPYREAGNSARPEPAPAALHLQCWPMDITSTHPSRNPPLPPSPPPAPMASFGEDIIVTGQRIERRSFDSPMSVTSVTMAVQEELGDLKLYRVPEPVTVAAKSRKQVAMIDRGRVRYQRIYTGDLNPLDFDPRDPAGLNRRSIAASVQLRTENRESQGLGLPLPAGEVAIFGLAGERRLLLGESDLADRAIGEEVELDYGESIDVRYRIVTLSKSARRARYRIEATNGQDDAAMFELVIPYQVTSSNARLVERKGRKTWRVTLPPGGEARLEVALSLN